MLLRAPTANSCVRIAKPYAPRRRAQGPPNFQMSHYRPVRCRRALALLEASGFPLAAYLYLPLDLMCEPYPASRHIGKYQPEFPVGFRASTISANSRSVSTFGWVNHGGGPQLQGARTRRGGTLATSPVGGHLPLLCKGFVTAYGFCWVGVGSSTELTSFAFSR